MTLRKRYIGGFTLVELLTVIAIISILAGIMYVSALEALKISRDNNRIANMKKLQLAVELFKEANGEYPLSCKGGSGADNTAVLDFWAGPNTSGTYACIPSDSNYDSSNPTNYIPALTSQYIQSLPFDDAVPNSNAGYKYVSNGTDYAILSHFSVESKTTDKTNTEFKRYPSGCLGSQPTSYIVYSPGARCW